MMGRDQLVGIAESYLRALERHDPAGAPLHKSVRSTLNGRELRPEEPFGQDGIPVDRRLRCQWTARAAVVQQPSIEW